MERIGSRISNLRGRVAWKERDEPVGGTKVIFCACRVFLSWNCTALERGGRRKLDMIEKYERRSFAKSGCS